MFAGNSAWIAVDFADSGLLLIMQILLHVYGWIMQIMLDCLQIFDRQVVSIFWKFIGG